MNISASAVTGISPLELTFTVVDEVVNLVKWMWLFGDGTSSTEKEPKHVYVAPGIYTVKLFAWDELGNEYTMTRENYIYVYDFPIGDNGLLSGITDFCFKHAVKTSQGQGIMPVGGSSWLWPALIAATAKGHDANHENVSLVINSDDMRIYRIGIPECWTDKDGSYDEAEVSCEAMLPEIVSRRGEHENVRHVETHVSMRSWDEKNYRRKAGYTADGFRDAHELSLEIFEGGEQIVPKTKLRKVNREGDYAFFKEVEARRFQVKLKYTTSAFRTTRIASHAQEIDHRTPPQTNDVVEKQWQKEFSTPDMWFSRNKPSFYMNRADGEIWAGVATATTGPDSKQSAMNSTGLSGVLAFTIGDFIILAWIFGDGVIFQSQVAGGGTFTMSVVGGVLRVTDGIDTIEAVLTNITTWVHVAVMVNGTDIELYENGRLKISQPLSSVRNYGGNTVIANGTVFDLRRIPKIVSADALYYYYESVLSGGGGFLP